MKDRSHFFTAGEDAREKGRRGGIKSAQVRKQKRELRETLKILLSLALDKKKTIDIEKVASLEDFNGQNLPVDVALLLGQIKKGIEGNTKAFSALMEVYFSGKEDETKDEKHIKIEFVGASDEDNQS